LPWAGLCCPFRGAGRMRVFVIGRGYLFSKGRIR
jgi:hypothetical protein